MTVGLSSETVSEINQMVIYTDWGAEGLVRGRAVWTSVSVKTDLFRPDCFQAFFREVLQPQRVKGYEGNLMSH